MKRKYLLRGIGIGIIIGAGVMYGAFATMDMDGSTPDTKVVAEVDTESDQKTSEQNKEEKTTEKATTEEKTTEKAATEEKTTEKATTEEKTTEEATTEEKTTEEATTEEKTTEEATTEEKTTEEATTEEKTTEEATTEEKTTEEATSEEKTTEEATSEEKTDSKNTDKGIKTITVSNGMNSEQISELLQNEGLVENWVDYNSWLIQNGYDSSLRVGTFEIKSGASQEEIAKILTTQGQ
ncbi:MAG: hypothetical protein K6E10_02185 [Eubacterium sp.]|nr:hypothetical protein [Eubacterium sp.]